MHVVRSGNVDRVDALGFFVKQLAPILVNSGVRKPLAQLRSSVEVNFGHRDQFELLELRKFTDVRPGHARGTEAGMAQNAIGRPRHQTTRDKWRRNSCGAQGLEEGTTAKGAVIGHKNLEELSNQGGFSSALNILRRWN